MTQTRVTNVGKSAAVVLPQELMEQIGLQIGDEVDVEVTDDALVVRRVIGEGKNKRSLDEIIDDIFERRAAAYHRLAEGSK
jgi:putative addiction module antidote